MLCNFCNKKINTNLSFKNLFTKPKLFCDNCTKIININLEIIENKYNHIYFANYNDIKEDIYKIKYFGQVEIALKYKKLLALAISDKKFDVITIAPSNKTRKAIRGFNHIEKICSLCNIEFIEIFEDEYREKQAKIHKKRNLHLFTIKNEHIEKVKNSKNILIIDDIFTSGKTLLSLSATLENINKNIKISFVTLAKTL